VEGALGKKAEIERLPDQPGDVPQTYADISKARRVLGYEPKVPFEEGLRAFVEWLRDGGRR
jgi:UDP-glucuronate 4-epimerase